MQYEEKTVISNQCSVISEPPRLSGTPSQEGNVSPITDCRLPITASRRSGLTLIEVLIAVVILGTVVLGLMQGMSQCLASFSLSKRIHELQDVLYRGNLEYPFKFTNDPMEELAVAPDNNIRDGYTYERFCEEIEDEETLYLVTTRVWFGSGGEGGNELSVVRYVYFKQ